MISRRQFVVSAVGAGAVIATQGCQQMAAQPPGKRMIVDAQIHLWKANTPDWPWLAGASPQLPEPFTIERLVPMMNEAGVDRVVIVPPSLNDRNDYALEAVKRYPGRFAVMGRISLQNPRSAALLPRWKEQPGMLGVRLTFNRGAAAWLKDGTADWFWPAAEKAGLPVMFLPNSAPTLGLFAGIAQRHPGLTLILDHMGLATEAIQNRTIPAVIDQAVALAKYPNVSIKISSIPNASLDPYPFRDMTVHLRRVFDAYGPRRCYWGTDITNSLAKATYRQRITHFTETLDFLSEEDKDWVMGRGILERLKWT
jgi:predicted TIM-barrel fold metal-dependent hydrolase